MTAVKDRVTAREQARHVIHGDDLPERWGEQLAQPSVGRQRELDLRASFTAGLGVAVAADRGVLLKPIGLDQLPSQTPAQGLVTPDAGPATRRTIDSHGRRSSLALDRPVGDTLARYWPVAGPSACETTPSL
jgi:hypothetical protein